MSKLISLDKAYLKPLLDIETACFSSPWSESSLSDYLDGSPRKLAQGWLESDLVGFALFSVIIDEAELLQVAVEPSKRKQGIAEKLLQQSFQQLKTRGVSRILLEVRASNVTALKLYKRLGFCEDGIRKAYYPPENMDTEREDAVLMSVCLS